MELSLAFQSDKPLYQQLYLHVRTLIQDGIVQDGVKLPSIRSLRQQINVSKTTIETAYQMLVEEGYARSKERSGIIVINPDIRTRPASSGAPPKQAARLALLPEAPNPRPASGMIDFSLLNIDPQSFPLRLWKSTMAEALSANNSSLHEYHSDPFGEWTLRESLAAFLRHSRGVVCTPDQMIIGSGFGYSVQVLSRLFGNGATIGIEDPGIAQVRPIFTQNDFHIAPYTVSEQGLAYNLPSPDGLHRPAPLLYATPSHRSDGASMPYAERLRLLQWAYDHEGFIIEDDYDGELRLSGKPVPSLQGLDKKGAVIYIGTFSKVFTPALRLNYMILPPNLLERLRAFARTLSSPSRMDQWAMQLFIARGHWYRHLRRLRRLYRDKHEQLVRLIRSELPAAVRITSSGSGLHLALTIATDASAESLIQSAREVGVLVYGNQNTTQRANQDEAEIYLGYGGLNGEEMEQGIRLLRQAWQAIMI
ncbi:PLP-dependent aminotransferase family protein [Cohnella soli]|uniref:PLP-dependent aminotransferase family protein n=1 Tax=Cohnella soli TaxID=425005 RepID=A0ABW0HU72_9BACL